VKRAAAEVDNPSTRIIQKEVVLGLHDRVLAFYGGQEGFRASEASALDNLSYLEAMVEQKAYSAPTSELAAYYLQDLVQTKPFLAGNRQTAWVCACVVIAKNNEPLVVPDYAQATRIILGAEKGVFTRDELARYFGKLILHGRALRDSLQATPKRSRPR